MPRTASVRLQHGPLTLFLSPRRGCPDLSALVRSLGASRPVVWLDSARCHPVTGRWSLVGFDPWLSLTARGDRLELHTSASTRQWRANPLTALRHVLREYRAPAVSKRARHSTMGAVRRAVGLLGWLSYDVNRFIERLPEPQPGDAGTPDMHWEAMKSVVLVDHLLQRHWLIGVADPHLPKALASRDALDGLERLETSLTPELGAWHGDEPGTEDRPSLVTLEATSTQAEFETMVRRALEHIRAGDIFQANVSQRFTAPWSGDAFPLYQRLRRINPSPFACYVQTPELSIVSC